MSDLAQAFEVFEAILPAARRVAPVGILGLATEPERPLVPVAPADPAKLGYPATFPFEIALRTSSVRDVCEAYGIDENDWELIRHDPAFLAQLAQAVKLVKQDGMSFKIKAKLQAEELLKTSWRTIHDATTPPSVRADLIKATMRWAEYDTPPAAGMGMANAFQVNIQFGSR